MLKPRTVEIKTVKEPGWVLKVIEGIPIQRVIWINFDAGHVRTGHATRQCEQVLFAQRGEVQVITERNDETKKFLLKPTGHALYIPEMTWRSYKCLTREAMLLVICSNTFRESDYIRDYESFKDEVRQS